jgi:hypothetical protein
MLTLTWKHWPTKSLSTLTEIRSAWDTWVNKLAEPFHSACASVPKDAPIWFERVAHWPTMEWDNRWGTVSLTGDAAHPMTFREHFLPPFPSPVPSVLFLHVVLARWQLLTSARSRSRS